MLYGIYQDALTKYSSKVNVKSIIAEEEGHLEEMQKMLEVFHPQWEMLAEDMCEVENKLFERWIAALGKMEQNN